MAVTRRELIKTAVVTAVATAGALEPRVAAADAYADQMAAKAAVDQREFLDQAQRLAALHAAQTPEGVAALKQKYERPVFGAVRMWDLIQRLALCVDLADIALGCANQLIHVQQMVEGMERDGIQDQDFYLAAMLHDVGKVILLAGEAQENVIGINAPIGTYDPGVGLDSVLFHWNCDEFIYSRLREHVPEHLAWLIRYHSIDIAQTKPYMNERDRWYFDHYLWPFRQYDGYTKSPWRVPPARLLDKYRDLVDKTFPAPISV